MAARITTALINMAVFLKIHQYRAIINIAIEVLYRVQGACVMVHAPYSEHISDSSIVQSLHVPVMVRALDSDTGSGLFNTGFRRLDTCLMYGMWNQTPAL